MNMRLSIDENILASYYTILSIEEYYFAWKQIICN